MSNPRQFGNIILPPLNRLLEGQKFKVAGVMYEILRWDFCIIEEKYTYNFRVSESTDKKVFQGDFDYIMGGIESGKIKLDETRLETGRWKKN